jgi:hypothetical protein
MQTRKHPRTLTEAFGPHTSQRIFEPQQPLPKEDIVVLAACCVAAVVLIGMAVAGWL